MLQAEAFGRPASITCIYAIDETSGKVSVIADGACSYTIARWKGLVLTDGIMEKHGLDGTTALIAAPE
jgi:hypothetical protein